MESFNGIKGQEVCRYNVERGRWGSNTGDIKMKITKTVQDKVEGIHVEVSDNGVFQEVSIGGTKMTTSTWKQVVALVNRCILAIENKE